MIDELKKETLDKFGIVIMKDRKGNVLFYADGSRESYIEIEDGYVKRILNYKPEKDY